MRVPTCCCWTSQPRIWTARASRWLVGRLAVWRDGLLVVSHDRRVLRAFSRFFVVAESGCRYVEGTFDHLLAELAREREDTERRYLGELNRLVAREEHNAAVRRRRQRKKNVGRIRELKRCPARILLNDKRSYKQESQGKRAVLQKLRIGAARDDVKPRDATLPVDLPLELALPRLPAGSSAPVIRCEAVTAAAGERPLFSALSLELGRERLAVCGPNGSGKTTLLEIALGLRAPVAGRSPLRHLAGRVHRPERGQLAPGREPGSSHGDAGRIGVCRGRRRHPARPSLPARARRAAAGDPQPR